MGKLSLVFLIAFLAAIGYAASTAISVKGDFERMQKENILVLITDEKNKNEVELGFGFLLGSGAEMFFVEPGTKIGDAALKTVFANSISSGAGLIAGKEVSGIFSINVTRNVKIDRIVVIPTSVFRDVANSIGGVDFSASLGAVSISRHFSGEEFASLLRADSVSDTSGWEVTFTNPLTRKLETQVKDGKELEKILLGSKAVDPRLANWWMVKGTILVQAAEGIDLKNKAIVGKIVEIVLSSYKSEAIQVHPRNTMTRLIKYVPVDAAKNKAVSLVA